MAGSYSDLRWEISTCNFYLPLEDANGWDKCPTCGQHPRTWVFDNGNYAKCWCSPKYGPNEAEAPSIIDAVAKGGMGYSKYKELLKTAWNKRCADLAERGEVE